MFVLLAQILCKRMSHLDVNGMLRLKMTNLHMSLKEMSSLKQKEEEENDAVWG